MKSIPLLALAAVAAFASLAHAQYSVVVVGDPIAQANHGENIAKWLESIQKLNTQIDQMNQYIQIGQQVKNAIGDPASVANLVGLDLLGSGTMGNSVGQLTSTLNQTASGMQALASNGQGLFQSVPNTTPSGLSMSYNTGLLKPFAAIQNQTQNAANVTADTTTRIKQLERDKASTLAQLKAATTDAEVQKLQAKLVAIDGEIAALNGQQTTATNQIIAQDIANRNDRALKAEAASQAADHELSLSLDNFMQWEGKVTPSRTPYK